MLARALAQIDHVVAVGLQCLYLRHGGARETGTPGARRRELGGQLRDVGVGLVERRRQSGLGVRVAALGRPRPRPAPLPRGDHVAQPGVPGGVVGRGGQRGIELGRLAAQSQREQVHGRLVVQFAPRCGERAPRRTDGLRVGVGECSHERIALGRRPLLDFRRESVGVVGQLLLGENRVVGRSDRRTLTGNLGDVGDTARPRTAGADVLEFADQLIARRE